MSNNKKNKVKKEQVEVVQVEESNVDIEIVQPSPVPSTFQVAVVSDGTPEQRAVMLAVSTPVGRSVYFLDAQIANVVGEALSKYAAQL